MDAKTIERLLFSSALLLLAALMPLLAPPDAYAGVKNSDIPDELRIYREAMVWFKKAEALIGTPKENSEEHAALFRKVIEIDPSFLEAHYNLGLIYANQKKIEKAAASFETVLALDHRFNGAIHFMLASLYQETGDDASAISALEKGLLRNPRDVKYLRALAFLQLRGNEDEAAVKTLEKILSEAPEDAASRVDLGVLHQKLGNDAAAEMHYEKALGVDPENLIARSNLVVLYHRRNRIDDALALLDKTRGIDGAELLEKIGDMYASRRQFSRAAAAYREARNRISDKTPLRAELLAKLGYNLAMINEIDEAVKALEESVMIGPDNAGSLALLGDLYADQGRNGEAVDAYRRSLAVDPERKEVHYNLGTLYLQSGKAEEAHAALKNAVKVDAGFIPAWDNLAVAAEQLDLDDQAVEAREMLVRLGVREARNYFRLGVLYAKTGRLDESIASFAAAIEKEPDKYREILRDELKNVRSILNGVRYKKEFLDLLTFPE